MPNKELSRSREGENQRSDQTQRDASSNNGRIRDFATHQYQLHDQQQREGKGMMTPEMEAREQREKIQQVIKQRDGKTGGEIPLGYQDGLRGGDIGRERRRQIENLVDKLVEMPSDQFNKTPECLGNDDIRSQIYNNKLNTQELGYAKECLSEEHGNLSAEKRNQVVELINSYYSS